MQNYSPNGKTHTLWVYDQQLGFAYLGRPQSGTELLGRFGICKS